jgi:hypothetical protein
MTTFADKPERPICSLEDLRPAAEKVLRAAGEMHKTAFADAESGAEILEILTNSLIHSTERAWEATCWITKKEHPSAKDEHRLCQQLVIAVLNAAGAALALLPMYEQAEKDAEARVPLIISRFN